MFLDLSAFTRTFSVVLILLISSFKFFWKLLLIFLNSIFFTSNINSFSKSDSSSTVGGHLDELKPYVSFRVESDFPRNSKVFHLIRLITLSTLDTSFILYPCFDGCGMFLVEYSILNVSIANSVTLYSAERLRSVSTITKNIFVVINSLECSMGIKPMLICKLFNPLKVP